LPSSADLAQLLGIPVLVVIDATGTAQTMGAIAYGLANLRPQLPFAGVLANRVGSARHQEMIVQGMPSDIRFYGALLRDANVAFGERHLGLMQAQEIADLDARLSAVAAAIATTDLAALPPAVDFTCDAIDALPKLLSGVRIGVACDKAFSFIYQANLDTLTALGAELIFYSPLHDEVLPDVDSLYLPGGYPELHLQQLQDNLSMRVALHEHFQQGKPIYAECGGMLYLLESLTDKNGERGDMVGLLPGHAVMQHRLQGLGYQSVTMPIGVLRSHTFHHSIVETSMLPMATGERLYNTSQGEHVYRSMRLTASYLHCYFPSNPAAVAELFLP
jgi:cobyrinic acid a,c-diamide synthase